MSSDMSVDGVGQGADPDEGALIGAGSAAVRHEDSGDSGQAGADVGKQGPGGAEAGTCVGQTGSDGGKGIRVAGGDSPPAENAARVAGRAASMVDKAISAMGWGLGSAYRLTIENRHYLNAVLNGFVGDRLAEAGDSLAISMSFRQDGRDVRVDELDLPARLRGAGRTVVVTLHGLMCDEVMFQETRWQSSSPSRPGHGLRLERELGATVLHVRYNSGRHISENGRALSALLQELVDACGADLDRLILVAHSMGGLVARSAGYYGTLDELGWVRRVSTVVLLAVPTQGSYLEQLANLSAFVLHRVGNLYTALGGQIIEQRSHGIRDLRFGFMADEDWRDHPLDDRLRATRTRIPPIEGVEYHVMVGTLGADEGSALALYFGDGLVGKRSACGEALFRQSDPLAACGSYRVFPSTGHFDILTSAEVGEQVVKVVSQAMEAPPRRG